MSPRASGPSFLRFLAGLLLPARDREFIVGDLEEMYARRAEREGRGAAGRGYLRDVLGSVAARVIRPPGGPRRRRWGVHARAGVGVDFFADVRAVARTLKREPRFAGLVVLTLALGVGSTAAVFGMVDQLLLRPLPGVHDEGHAAYLQFHSVEGTGAARSQGLPTLAFDEMRRDATLLDGIASYGLADLDASLGDARPVNVWGMTIYGDFFEVLGVRPAAGRLLRASETDLREDPSKAVISEKLARKLFGSTQNAVGKTLALNEHPVTVVGVAGGGFAGLDRSLRIDVWIPYGALVPVGGFTRERLLSPQSVMHDHLVVQRASGSTTAAVVTQLTAIVRRLGLAENASGAYMAKLEANLFPGLQTAPGIRSRTYSTLRLVAGVVTLVLLITCANVANLLLFRNVSRRGAVATRRALGASQGRIARQHLVQSVVLGLMGTGAGLGVGWLIATLFRGERLLGMPMFDGLALDGRLVLFAGLASLGTALLFGTLPAVLAGRFDLAESLRQAGGRVTGRMARLRSALSAGQLALTLALVVGAGLLIRTVHNLYAVDLGLDTDGVSALWLQRPHDLSASETLALYRTILTSVETVPGVEAAALDPYGPNGSRLLGRAGLPGTPEGNLERAQFVPVSPGWFDLFHAALVSGHAFRPEDWGRGAEAGVVLTESLARRLFGRTDVTGETVAVAFGSPIEMRVVGVVRDIREAYQPDEPVDAFFAMYGSLPGVQSFPYVTLSVRTNRFDVQVAQDIRNAVESALPDEPVALPALLSDRVDRIHSEQRVLSQLLELLSALAAILAAVGLYAVIAFVAAGRRREFGVRLALGAEASRIARLVFGYASQIIATGTVLGLGGAYVLSRLLKSRLFGVEPLDPTSWAAAVVFLTLVAATACWIPARRAMRVDPAATLREE